MEATNMKGLEKCQKYVAVIFNEMRIKDSSVSGRTGFTLAQKRWCNLVQSHLKDYKLQVTYYVFSTHVQLIQFSVRAFVEVILWIAFASILCMCTNCKLQYNKFYGYIVPIFIVRGKKSLSDSVSIKCNSFLQLFPYAPSLLRFNTCKQFFAVVFIPYAANIVPCGLYSGVLTNSQSWSLSI